MIIENCYDVIWKQQQQQKNHCWEGKNSTKRASDDMESRDKNHPQKSIVKYLFAFFFLFFFLLSCLLNLCNQRGLFKYIFNGISTINFIYCHMLMISPFERYRQCWFSKALNTCVGRIFYHSSPSIPRKLFDILSS